MAKVNRILIAEDDMIIQLFISRVLTNAGFEVVGEARNSEKIVELAEEHRPDLILMDIGLDGKKDGVDAANEINSKCKTPILFLTGNSDESTMERAKSTDPIGFVLKPIDEVRLIDVIKNI